MKRIFFTTLVLLSVVPAAYPQDQDARPGTKKMTVSPRRKVDDQQAEKMGPGVGAYSQDPRKILRAAEQAIRAVRSLVYEASYQSVGAMATHAPVVAGEVNLSRLAAGNPLKAMMAARGVFFPGGSDEAGIFHTTFDGRTIRKLRPKEKTLVIKTLSGGDPGERTFGFVTSFFGGGPYHLLMLEYLQDTPFARQAEASTADHEGRAAVNGVLCHVVYVEYPAGDRGGRQKERWFFGIKDHLPRKFERLVDDDNGRPGAYVLTLSNLRANVTLRSPIFTARVPRGYVIKRHAPPARPALLAEGELAPDWKLTDPTGQVHSLSDYRGKVVVLEFWATWCGPCIRAMPGLQRVHEEYQGRGVVFGVNTWEESNAVEFMRRSGYTYGLLLKGEDVAKAYRVSSLPTLYVIGVDGKIVHRLSGVEDGLEVIIEKLLKEHEM